MMNKIKKTVIKNIKPILLSVSLILGILLIALSEQGSDKDGENNLQSYDGFTKLDIYTEDIEKRLGSIISDISGAGNTKVMISFESSFESVYANNAKLEENTSVGVNESAKTTEKQIVLASDKQSGETPVLLKEVCPKVKGVLVVCSGGNNEKVCTEVKKAVTALFGISETKVYVTAGDSGQNK